MRNLLPVVLAVVLSPLLLADELERVVIPVAYSEPGGYGAFWVTTIGAWNRTATPWATPGVTFIENCPIPEGCETEELGPERSGRLLIANTDGFQAPHGFILYIPSEPDSVLALWARSLRFNEGHFSVSNCQCRTKATFDPVDCDFLPYRSRNRFVRCCESTASMSANRLRSV